MSLFNKHGVEFQHLVCVNRDPNVDPTYTHPFPTYNQAKQRVETRFARKIRAIKSLTTALQGVRLKRYRDYMIDYNAQTQQYEYWFLDPAMATLFALVAATLTQTFKNGPGHQFDIECPHCKTSFPTSSIIWR